MEPEGLVPDALLEDEDQQAIGRSHRNHVQDDGFDSDDDGPEDHGEQHEAYTQYKREYHFRGVVGQVVEVHVQRRPTGDVHLAGIVAKSRWNVIFPYSDHGVQGLVAG